jgi:hypothetical protein
MILASSKGWFFGWHESLPELMAHIEKLAALKEPDVLGEDPLTCAE